jgi:hypothetical protein
MINSLEHPIVIIDAIVGIFTVIILFLQLCVFRKQAGIAKKQNEIIQNQLTIDSRREHSIEIKSNLISKLKVEIEQMPYAEIKIPQFDDKDGDNWEIKIEDNFNLTKLNFFEKVKPYMPDLNLTMNNNIRDINDKNVLYNDLLDNHLGKDKDYFINIFDSFLGYSNKYNEIFTGIQQKFKINIENDCKGIGKRTIQYSFDDRYGFLLIIYCSWLKNLGIYCSYNITKSYTDTDIDNDFKIEPNPTNDINFKEHMTHSIKEMHRDDPGSIIRAGGSEQDLNSLLAVSQELLKYCQTEEFKTIKSNLSSNKSKIEELKPQLLEILTKINNRPILEGSCKFITD